MNGGNSYEKFTSNRKGTVIRGIEIYIYGSRSEFLLQKDSRRLSDFPGTCECFQ